MPWGLRSRVTGLHADYPRERSACPEVTLGVSEQILDLLKAGRTVTQIAHDLQISDQTIYTWRRQALVYAGQEPGLTSVEKAELASARRRIAELEAELAIHQRAAELLKEAVPVWQCSWLCQWANSSTSVLDFVSDPKRSGNSGPYFRILNSASEQGLSFDPWSWSAIG